LSKVVVEKILANMQEYYVIRFATGEPKFKHFGHRACNYGVTRDQSLYEKGFSMGEPKFRKRVYYSSSCATFSNDWFECKLRIIVKFFDNSLSEDV
jgi:hypothetical protein